MIGAAINMVLCGQHKCGHETTWNKESENNLKMGRSGAGMLVTFFR